MGLLVIGIGSLQVMLDKGQQEDWFASRFIMVLTIAAAIGLVGLVIRELHTAHPIVNLRVFKNRTYATGVFLMTVLGFVLYGSTVLLPLLMQTLLGYPALEAGLATLPRGFASFIAMPIVGILMGKVEARKLLAGGLVASSFSLYLLSRLNLNIGISDFVGPLLLQGAALGLLFIPLTTITNDPIPKEEMGNATSLFNLMRNIGASIGIAMVTTVLARKQQVHVNQLGEHVTNFDAAARQMVSAIQQGLMSQGSDAATAARQAQASVWGMVQQHAAMMSYNDVFFLLAVLFAVMLPLILLMRKPKHQGGDIAVH
jgi:DHA2 family multidrug resistance protein